MVWTILAWMAALLIAYVVILFFGMVLQAPIAEILLLFSRPYVPLHDGVAIKEISKNEKPLRQQYTLGPTGTGDLPASIKMLLQDDGSITKGKRVLTSDPGKEVKVLQDKSPLPSLVVIKNKIYEFEGKQLGKLAGEFSGEKLNYIDHVISINDKYLLVIADLAIGPDDKTRLIDVDHLWQVERATFIKEKITKDIYFPRKRPPMAFTPQSFDGVVVVYYTGSYHFAMGGDASRPRFSVIRIYNSDYPDGKNLAKFNYKAGTIVDVRGEKGCLILTGDPSRPGMVNSPDRPARVWRLQYQKISSQ